MNKSSIEIIVDESDSLFSSPEAIEYTTKIFKQKLTNYYE